MSVGLAQPNEKVADSYVSRVDQVIGRAMDEIDLIAESLAQHTA